MEFSDARAYKKANGQSLIASKSGAINDDSRTKIDTDNTHFPKDPLGRKVLNCTFPKFAQSLLIADSTSVYGEQQ